MSGYCSTGWTPPRRSPADGRPADGLPEVQFRGDVEKTWQETDCTCGNGDALGHFLRCAKWVAVLPNHADRAALADPS